MTTTPEARQLKDDVLARLAATANVAQFVSFDPSLRQRRARIRGLAADHQFESVWASAARLLNSAPSVNVRSFDSNTSKSREFIYGLGSSDDVTAQVSRLASLGLYTIVNETIDVSDGGISGVALGNLIEFAPGDTPRCVEKPGTASLPRELALRLLERVYSFRPDLDSHDVSERVEFSIHPLRRGIRHEHTIVWEKEHVGSIVSTGDISWPNRFSRFIGDKAFGLLVADVIGLPVPATTVISRSLPPFSFGEITGSSETWIRTCPVEQDPGRYTTRRGWLDPFLLLAREDPDGTKIASVLAQRGVHAEYSGSLIVENDGRTTVEGVSGYGDDFMLGRSVGVIPDRVKSSVLELYEAAKGVLGPVRFEWVNDHKRSWVVQLHKGATASLGKIIFPGEATKFARFEVKLGINALRELMQHLDRDEGIIVAGEVGITSHIGDLLRRARIPSRIEA